ncbi:MAG: 50S ribosomal protein L11 methyltransferase [Mangrovicoccus sp.]
MTTWTALTTLASRQQAEALGEALEELDPTPTGVGVFEIEDGSGLWEVGVYFIEEPDDVALDLLAAAFGARPFAVSELPETDWVAKVQRELAPVEAGRFFLYGSHDADKVPEDRIALLIDAAMAFGTGHHGTTKGCLEALDALANEGVVCENTADIGCGTAVLAMGAAKLWPGKVRAGDIDPVAVDVAHANLAANDLTGRVICVEAAGFGHPELTSGVPYDLIFANILKAPLIDLAPEISAHCADGGFVILSGILNEQAAEVISAYEAVKFSLHRHSELGEWSTLTMRKA